MSDDHSLHLTMDTKLGVSRFSMLLSLDKVLYSTCDRGNFGVSLFNVPDRFTGLTPENSKLSLFSFPVAVHGFCFPCPLLT